MSEIISIPIIELMEKTERWLLDHDYKKSTIGVYKATWNKFRVFSASPFYDRDTAKKFVFRYFGIDENAVVQKCDKRMQQARRHMDVLDEFLRTGQICRRKIRSMTAIDDDGIAQNHISQTAQRSNDTTLFEVSRPLHMPMMVCRMSQMQAN